MKRWLRFCLIAGGLLALAGFLVAASGLIPLRASSGHWAITEWLLRFGMKRSTATHSVAIKVPDDLNDHALVQKGAGYYEVGCRSCHGEPGMPLPGVAAHMLPKPPDLVPRIRESDPKKLFYVVKHGMKFTGMPAWPSPQRDDEVWAVIAFLLRYPELNAAEYRLLSGRDERRIATGSVSSTSDHLHPPFVASCATCHGSDGRGRGNALIPSLAGQRGPYLRKALEAYANGRRHSGMMEPVAIALARDDVEQISDYYSRLPRATSVAIANVRDQKSDILQRGEIIASEGIRSQRVPACLECHAPGGRRGKPEYPLLAGQPAAYLELQLTLFREGHRGGSDHAHLMQPIAARLKPEQIRDVAAYFASRSERAAP
jgi:cytochrome c553/cytochrome c5